jgi:tetratricopeptide (TPR) repeat protein
VIRMATRQEEEARFGLKTALGLIEDVAQQTAKVAELHKRVLEQERFWEGLQAAWQANRELAGLRADLASAIELATSSARTWPDVQLDDGTSPQMVIAEAHFQDGLIDCGIGEYEKAIQKFRLSYQTWPSQSALFNVALCQAMELWRLEFGGGTGFLKWMFGGWFFGLLDPRRWQRAAQSRQWLGVLLPFIFNYRGRFRAEEVIDTFKRVIDMDPGSEVAVEAGKWVARIGRL